MPDFHRQVRDVANVPMRPAIFLQHSHGQVFTLNRRQDAQTHVTARFHFIFTREVARNEQEVRSRYGAHNGRESGLVVLTGRRWQSEVEGEEFSSELCVDLQVSVSSLIKTGFEQVPGRAIRAQGGRKERAPSLLRVVHERLTRDLARRYVRLWRGGASVCRQVVGLSRCYICLSRRSLARC